MALYVRFVPIILGGGGPGGVTVIGPIDSQTPSINGAVIVGNKLYMQSASVSDPGLVNNATQSLSGDKTFTGQVGVIGTNTAGQLAVSGTSTLSLTTQNAFYANLTSNAAATLNVRSFRSGITTAANTTIANVTGYHSTGVTVGSGGAITHYSDFIALGAALHPSATSNVAFTDTITPNNGNWFLYQAGTDPSHFGGTVTANIFYQNPAAGSVARTVQGWIGDQYFSVEDFGADPTGAVDATTHIQAAATAATAAGGTLYFPAGIYLVSGTITAACHISGAQASLVTSTDIVVLQLGNGTNLLTNKLLYLPNIVNSSYVSPGWSGTNWTGVKAINLSNCEIHTQLIVGFIYGMWCTTAGVNDHGYNNYFLGSFTDNKVQLRIEAGTVAGATNENNFYGGHFGYSSNQISGTSGCRQLLIKMFQNASGNPPNNNVFYKPSFEDDAPEFTVEINSGQFNYIDHARWESTSPSVTFTEFSSSLFCVDNTINLGFGAQHITVTSSTHSVDNKLYTDLTSKEEAHGGVAGIDVKSNTDGSQYPILTGLEAQTGGNFWTLDPSSAYAFQLCANQSLYKAQADSVARIRLSHADGRIYFGDGTTALGAYIDNAPGTSNLRMPGGNLAVTGSISASNFSGSSSGANTGDVTLAAVGSSPSANAASLSGQVLTLQPFDGTHPGVVTSSGGGSTNFLRADGTWATPAGSTPTAVTSVGAFGSTPSANAASISSNVLTLQPADGTHPGGLSTGTQEIAGAKVFDNVVGVVSSTTPSTTSLLRVGGGTNPLSGVTQIGETVSFTGTSAATTQLTGYSSTLTQAGSITTGRTVNYNANVPTLGSGSTINRTVDFLAGGAASHIGAANAAFADDSTFAFLGNWFLYQIGTDNSGLGGSLLGTGANGAVPIRGTNTNDSAASTFIGEQIISRVTTATNVGTSVQWSDYTSITLTAGDWDVTGIVSFTLNGAVMTAATNARIAISLTSGNSATGIQQGDNSAEFPVPATTSDRSGAIAAYRVSASGSTVVYLKGFLSYTGGPPQQFCRLSARRVR